MFDSDALVEQTGENDWLHAAAAAVPAVVVPVGVLAIVVGAAATLKLSDGQLVGWMLALYALPGLIGAWLAVRHRQPLVLTGNVFAIILFASEGGRLTFEELAGASVLAGIVVTILGIFGLTARLARWIPMPIVMGMLAGAVLPFVVRVFTSLDAAPLIVGGTLVAYLVAIRAMGQVAGLPAAIVTGLLLAAVSGQLAAFAMPVIPSLGVTVPSVSIVAIAAVTPILVIMITVQSNIPSVVFLRSQDYDPPERQVDVISGVATVLGSVLGPNAVSIPLPLMGVIAGPDAGPPAGRYRAAVVVGAALVIIGALGTVAVALLAILPAPLIQALAGLALLRVLTSAVQTFARGPLILGPVIAMVVAQSSLTLLGLAPLFWALVIGIAVSTLLERDGLRRLRGGVGERAT
jgi:benzoate membrane transport protein